MINALVKFDYGSFWPLPATTMLVKSFIFYSILCSGIKSWPENRDLYIINLNSQMEGMSDEKYGLVPAVDIAIDIINNRSDILPGYTLKVIHTKNEGKVSQVVKNLLINLITPPIKLGIIGPTNALECIAISEIVKQFQLLQITGTGSSDELMNYDRIFRTVPSDNVFVPAILEVLKYFKWDRVATIYTDPDAFEVSMKTLITEMNQNNYSIVYSGLFDTNPEREFIDLKESDGRIILTMFEDESGRDMMCQAYKNGIYAPRFQWIYPEATLPKWWNQPESNGSDKSPCIPNEIKTTIEGAIVIRIPKLVDLNLRTFSGYTPLELSQMLYSRTKISFNFNESDFSQDITYTFDAVWALALALNSSILKLPRNKPLENFRYSDRQMGKVIINELYSLNFLGMTGDVNFDSHGNRFGQLFIFQLQDGAMVKIGTYDETLKRVEWNDSAIRWKDHKVPMDDVEKITKHLHIDPTLFRILSITSLIGVLFSLICLMFNIYYRNNRHIKLSSPRMNSLIAIGCIMCYGEVPLLGLSVEGNGGTLICNARVWVLSLGFSISFGSMFAKTWRVHVIFTNKKLKTRIIKDWHLFLVVGAVTLIDLSILIAWRLLDRISVLVFTINTQDDPNNNFIIWAITKAICTSFFYNRWMISIYTVKGLLLLFGIFFVWETRTVKIPALNDSKQIGFCIYNVVTMCCIGVPIANILDNSQANIIFTICSLCILLSTTMTLCLIFITKMYILCSENTIVASIRENFEESIDGNPSSLPGGTNVHTVCNIKINLLNSKINDLELKLKALTEDCS